MMAPLFMSMWMPALPPLSHMRIPLLPPPLQIELEMDDVAQERERVEQMMARGETAPIIIRDLRKTFPSQDGNK